LIPTVDGNNTRGREENELEVVDEEEEDGVMMVFPFACRDDIVCDVDKLLGLDPT